MCLAKNIALLSVAAAFGLLGFNAGAAFACVVSMLIEVQVLPLVVNAVNRAKGWCERGGVWM